MGTGKETVKSGLPGLSGLALDIEDNMAGCVPTQPLVGNSVIGWIESQAIYGADYENLGSSVDIYNDLAIVGAEQNNLEESRLYLSINGRTMGTAATTYCQ